MKGFELTAARERLGELWELGRPLRKTELGRAIGLEGKYVHQTIWRWEASEEELPGPVSRVLDAMLNHGYRPDFSRAPPS